MKKFLNFSKKYQIYITLVVLCLIYGINPDNVWIDLLSGLNIMFIISYLSMKWFMKK